MKSWSRPFAYLAVIAVVAAAYFIGRAGRGSNDTETTPQAHDPGYAAHDAEIIETGYDGRERYRLNAKVIRQQTETGIIELEDLEMNYQPGAQAGVPGESRPAELAQESWHLRANRGQVRADGDDVQLTGDVRVTGARRGSSVPLVLTTSELRINTPTEFIETDAPVKISWAGHEIDTRGLRADLKAGKLRLESDLHGQFSQK